MYLKRQREWVREFPRVEPDPALDPRALQSWPDIYSYFQARIMAKLYWEKTNILFGHIISLLTF